MYDVVIQNGLVVDGSGRAPYQGTVCLKDGKIAAITQQEAEGARVLDAAGRVVCPGFIDIHSHSDAAPLVGYPVESKIAQGVTTEITGNCGNSCIPATEASLEELHRDMVTSLQMPLHGAKVGRLSITDYAADAQRAGIVGNFGCLVGHGTLRLAVMGFVDRDPTGEELEQLKALLDRELERGAFGMSLGLIYPPSAFSAREELVELAKVVKKHEGLLAVHMRNEGPRIFEAVDEVLDIAQRSGVHLQISHLKLMGKPQWGRSSALLEKIEGARARGIHVTCDQYPFTASSTSLTAVVPNWAHDGGPDAMMQRLREGSERLRREMREKIEERGGEDTILVTSTNSVLPEYEGQYLSKIAQTLGTDGVEAAIQLLLRAETVVKCVYFCISQEDMLAIMPKEYVCVGSDGYAYSYDPVYTPMNFHPRSFGTYPQFFQLVREQRLMPIETAVHKATGLPAGFLGLRDRGLLQEGLAGDVVVFDPEEIENLSTYTQSKVRPKGIDYVLVNGEVVMDHNRLTGAQPGRVLLHGGGAE